jgi:2-keto-3-deoxy-L-rhamnonate aldolase RhmA
MGKTGDVTDSEVVAAIERVAEACRRQKLALGYFGLDAGSVRPYMDRGYRLICVGVDAGFVTAGAGAALEALKP